MDSKIINKTQSLRISDSQTHRKMSYASGRNKDMFVHSKKRGVIAGHICAVRPSLSTSNNLEKSYFDHQIQSYHLRMRIDSKVCIIWLTWTKNGLINYRKKKFIIFCQIIQLHIRKSTVESFITVGRPRYTFHRKRYFYGRIQILHFVEEVLAHRNS